MKNVLAPAAALTAAVVTLAVTVPQIAAARAEVADLTATLHGQYEVNAEYAERMGTPEFYEDGSWSTVDGQTGCAPTALCDDTFQATQE